MAWPVLAGAETYYVNDLTGNDSWMGTFPDLNAQLGPKKTIQAAINMAQDGDTVVVADGIYSGSGNYDLDFSASLINDARSLTLVSANGPQSCIIDCLSVGRGFWFVSGESRQAVLDGFTIRNGVGYEELVGSSIRPAGGGIFCCDSSPTIKNCIVQQNWLGILGVGAGIYCYGNSSPLIVGCVITKNRAGIFGAGGGIYCGGDNCRLTISNCRITANTGGMAGGAVFAINQGCYPELQQTLIAGNSAGEGAGICLWEFAQADIVNSTITENVADYGGALRCQNSNVQINNSILWNNQAQSETGAEISLECDTGQSCNCNISYSILAGGTNQVSLGTECLLVATEILDTDPLFAAVGTSQSAEWSAGDYHLRSENGRYDSQALNRCDFSGDGKIQLEDFAILAANWQVTSETLTPDLNRDQIVDIADFRVFSRGLWGPRQNRGWWFNDTIDSPALDAGPVESPWHNELWPHGQRINLGAYGNTPQASGSPNHIGNVADTNLDNIVNNDDLLSWAGLWLVCQDLLAHDFNRDGKVNLLDWAILNNNWLWADLD